MIDLILEISTDIIVQTIYFMSPVFITGLLYCLCNIIMLLTHDEAKFNVRGLLSHHCKVDGYTCYLFFLMYVHEK